MYTYKKRGKKKSLKCCIMYGVRKISEFPHKLNEALFMCFEEAVSKILKVILKTIIV